MTDVANRMTTGTKQYGYTTKSNEKPSNKDASSMARYLSSNNDPWTPQKMMADGKSKKQK